MKISKVAMKFKNINQFIKKVVVCLLLFLFIFSPMDVLAVAPIYYGTVKNSVGTGIPGVWVRMTNLQGYDRYIQTDASGVFRFPGWTSYVNPGYDSSPGLHEAFNCSKWKTLPNIYNYYGDTAFTDQATCQSQGYTWYGDICWSTHEVNPPNWEEYMKKCNTLLHLAEANRIIDIKGNGSQMVPQNDTNYNDPNDNDCHYTSRNTPPSSADPPCVQANPAIPYAPNNAGGSYLGSGSNLYMTFLSEAIFGCGDADNPHSFRAVKQYNWNGYLDAVPDGVGTAIIPAVGDQAYDATDTTSEIIRYNTKDIPNATYDLHVGDFIFVEYTPTPTSTRTPTPTASRTPTPSSTPTSTRTPTPTNTVVPSPTPTNTVIPTSTPTPSNTPVPPTNTPTNTTVPTRTPTPSSTRTPTPTNTTVPTRTPTPSSTRTPTPTNTTVPTRTPTPSSTRTPTPTNTTVPTRTPTPSSTRTPTPTNTTVPTRTPTPSSTRTPTPTNTTVPTRTPTPSSTRTPTPTNTTVPTRTPTPTLTSSPTPTSTATPTPTPYVRAMSMPTTEHCSTRCNNPSNPATCNAVGCYTPVSQRSGFPLQTEMGPGFGYGVRFNISGNDVRILMADALGSGYKDASGSYYYYTWPYFNTGVKEIQIALISNTPTPIPTGAIVANIYADNGSATQVAGKYCVNGGNTYGDYSTTDFTAKIREYTASGTYVGLTTKNVPSESFSVNTVQGHKYNISLSIDNQSPASNYYECACLPDGETTCEANDISHNKTDLAFYLSNLYLGNGGWWQINGGSIFSNNASNPAVKTIVPDVCTDDYCSYITADLPDNINSPGFILTNGGSVADPSKIHAGSFRNQANKAKVTDFIFNNNKYENYAFFNQQVGDRSNIVTVNVNPASRVISKPSGLSTDEVNIYKYDDSIILNDANPWVINDNEKLIVFVEGNLTIDDADSTPGTEKVTSFSNNNGFLAFIVQGDIIINPSVGYADPTTDIKTTPANIEGLFVADGWLKLEGFSDAAIRDNKFIGAGTFTGWSGVLLSRDFENTTNPTDAAYNNTYATENFVFRPDLIYNYPEEKYVRTSQIEWSQVFSRGF